MTKEKTLQTLEPQEIQVMGQGDVDIAVSTAKQYPRDVKLCLENAISMATMNQEIAESCIYNLPRGGKRIPGKSIRCAELVAHNWGNMRVAKGSEDPGDTHVIGIAVAWDLESNTQLQIRTRRRITDKNGRRYNADGLEKTSNAVASIAARNAIFAVVPQFVSDAVYEAARNMAVGDQEGISDRREKCFQTFEKQGIDRARVLARMHRQSEDQITLEDIEALIGIHNEIKEGEVAIDQAFPSVETSELDQARAAFDDLVSELDRDALLDILSPHGISSLKGASLKKVNKAIEAAREHLDGVSSDPAGCSECDQVGDLDHLEHCTLAPWYEEQKAQSSPKGASNGDQGSKAGGKARSVTVKRQGELLADK